MRIPSADVDRWLSKFARRRPPHRAGRMGAKLAAPWPTLVEGLLVAAALRASGRPALPAAIAAPAADAVGKALKKLAHRGRPGRARFGKNGRESFPSTHMAGPTALLACAFCLAPRTRTWRAGLAAATGAVLLIGIERVCAGKHWASDIAVGATLGIATGALLGRVAARRGVSR
jgi:membrane-associated phospholipid phosphatase